MKTKLIMVPLAHGCHVEGADLGIAPIIGKLNSTNLIEVSIGGGDDVEVITGVSNQIAKEMEACYANNEFPLTIGGDHSLGIGSVAAASKRNKVGIIWLDAHGDINTLKTTSTFRIHGMPLAVSLGDGYESLVNCYYPGPKISNEQIVYIGSRDFDAGELQYVQDHQIPVYTYASIRDMGLTAFYPVLDEVLQQFDEIHLSFDLDVIDPNEFGAVNIPVNQGFTKKEVLEIVSHLFQKYRICSSDVVEYNPLLDEKHDIDFVVEVIETIVALVEEHSKIVA